MYILYRINMPNYENVTCLIPNYVSFSILLLRSVHDLYQLRKIYVLLEKKTLYRYSEYHLEHNSSL